MSLSPQSIESLIDLVEIKLSCMQVFDREDAREQAGLERCLRELGALRKPSRRPAAAPAEAEEQAEDRRLRAA